MMYILVAPRKVWLGGQSGGSNCSISVDRTSLLFGGGYPEFQIPYWAE